MNELSEKQRHQLAEGRNKALVGRRIVLDDSSSSEEGENTDDLASEEEGESPLVEDNGDVSETDNTLFKSLGRSAAPSGSKCVLINQKTLDNLYCVQWVNIVDTKPVPTHLYKIGRGKEGREKRVHGTNPVRFTLIRKWNGVGHLEANIHDQLSAYHYYQGAGREWFYLEHVNDNVGRFLDECVLIALRGDVTSSSDCAQDHQ